MKKMQAYFPDTAEEVMARKIPTARKSDTVGHVLNELAKNSWDDIETVYVTSEEEGLLGLIPIHTLLISQRSEQLSKVMEHVRLKVSPHEDQEQLVIEAIHKDVTSVPVVDHQNHLLGAVTSDQIVDILHKEHLEDLLRASGIRGEGTRILDLINGRLRHVILARLPWLIVGLGIGFISSLIVSRFEQFLNTNVEIAFFISMIAYMSGAMSTQSETMFIRAVTVLKINIGRYLVRELFVGIIIGAIVGVLAGLGAYILSHSVEVALAVGLALLISMSVATVLACVVPWVIKSLGRDPAIGSGPFATAIQDLLSITIYFLIAHVILRGV
jgi:magnesium transporter